MTDRVLRVHEQIDRDGSLVTATACSTALPSPSLWDEPDVP